jgi:hypothetical protein
MTMRRAKPVDDDGTNLRTSLNLTAVLHVLDALTYTLVTRVGVTTHANRARTLTTDCQPGG